MFGHTTEFVIRKFSKEYNTIKDLPLQAAIFEKPITDLILPDGSMHSYRKEIHKIDYENIPTPKINSIVSPIYPSEFYNLKDIADKFSKFDGYSSSSRIVMYADSLEAAEFNMLVQWKKVISLPNTGERVMFGNFNNDVDLWNEKYTSFEDAERWELREWFSIFYSGWTSKWIDNHHEVDSQYLKISNSEYLNDMHACFKKIFDYCNLTFDESLTDEYNNFIDYWLAAQQPIIDEHALVNNIVDAVVKNYDYSWNDLNIIQESIIQKKLRDNGVEIECWNLNTLPKNTNDLKAVLKQL